MAKVLMVLTSHDRLGDTGQPTGFWLEEFAAPYYVLKDAGVDITIASPKGGQPPIDPKSDDPKAETPAMQRFRQDPEAQRALANTVNGSGASGGTDLRVRHRFAATVALRGYTGGATDVTAVANYLIARNAVAPTASAVVNTTAPFGGQFTNTPGGGACPTP